jgi:hypothetical protein
MARPYPVTSGKTGLTNKIFGVIAIGMPPSEKEE